MNRHLLVLLAAAAAFVPTAAAAPPRTATEILAALGRPAFCSLPRSARSLPATARRGLAQHLRQYPDLRLATGAQLAAAARILAETRRAAAPWRDPRAAAAAGFDIAHAKLSAGDPVEYFHAERRPRVDDGRDLDPRRPEVLIYANAPGRPLRLVGVMFAMARGQTGPTPAGPIVRWHWHRVCVQGKARGKKPLRDGTCPRGSHLYEGSEMLHLWFTRDLRSAFAIHAPEPELCRIGLLPTGYCRTSHGLRGM